MIIPLVEGTPVIEDLESLLESLKILFLKFTYVYYFNWFVFIIFDTKLIIDRSYKVYKKEDFIIASINLYLDIINLFMCMIQCLSFQSEIN